MNVFRIKRKGYLLILALILFSISSCKQDTKKVIYFIPRGYKGWVNIVYTDTATKAQPFRFDNGYLYIITGDPSDFKMAYDQSLDKWRETDYY